MGRFLAAMVATFAFVACSPGSTAAPSDLVGPVLASDEQGKFRLELELPKRTFAAGEPIEGVARLRFAGPGSIDVAGAAGGLIGFSLIDVDGPRDVGGGQDAACAAYTIDPAQPFTKGLVKSGGFSPDDPNDDFIEAFLNDPVYRLPAGTWEIQAWSNFLGKDCTMPETRLSVAVRIVVTD